MKPDLKSYHTYLSTSYTQHGHQQKILSRCFQSLRHIRQLQWKRVRLSATLNEFQGKIGWQQTFVATAVWQICHERHVALLSPEVR
jgi:hypothetical protein